MKRIFWILAVALGLGAYAQTRLVVNVGNTANDGTGDSVRIGFQKVNTNFATLWNTVYTNGTGGGGGGTNYLFDTHWFSVSGTNVTLQSSVVLTNDWYVTNASKNVNFGPLAGFFVTATNMAVTGSSSAIIGGPVATVLGTSELDLWTPGVNASTATAGQFLKLINASTGKAEWATAAFLPLAGGTLSGVLNMGGSAIQGVGAPTLGTDAANKSYVDTKAANYLPLAGGTMTGAVNAGGYTLSNLGAPSASGDAATKSYVDSAAPGINVNLRAWTQSAAYQLTSATYDSDNVLSSATVTWPDGSGGTFTRTVKNSTYLTVDAFTITHTTSGKTVTQSTVTRNSNGSITAQPTLSVAP